MIKKLLVLVLLSMSVNVMAANDQVPGDRIITEIRTYKTYALVYISPGFENTQGCTHTSNSRLMIDMAGGAKKEIYTMAMAAAMAGKNIGLGISGCAGTGGYPSIYRLDVAF